MKLLLDTHAFIWFTQNDAQLSARARSLILDPNNESVISAVSLWEIAIKVSIGKLNLTETYDVFMARECQAFSILPVTLNYTSIVSTLPFPPKHNDPFDRLLVAQAMVEQMPIVSGDAALDQYAIKRLW